MTVPPDVTALVRAGHLEEVEPGLFRRPRLPSRGELYDAGDREMIPSFLGGDREFSGRGSR